MSQTLSTTRPLFGQTAIVTGASRGIGRAIALALAKAGANVAVNYLTREKNAREVVLHCRSYGSNALAIQGNVTLKPDVTRLFEEASMELGPVTILINNAGIAQSQLFLDTTETDWDQLMNANLKAPFYCIQAALPTMLRKQYGRIINISSIWGIAGGSCEVAYSASKGGLIALTKALAKELGTTGITVNAVAPGAIDTEMIQALTEEDRARISADTPVGRLGTPDDIANTVLFLASPQTSFLTGQIISPNGGLLT
ncbi:elongation factor P 5-aminopentanone reductase [Ferroacidibacillus organovorans]|uniref:3-ketoacyl-ACP reductase n=1 Tax=Ferroacidibacillus organovorans TaxID=1765683 RepID=A0A1V4EUB7_9BACL|nr:3-oxoacyl-ACP reductase FabG [Ferroacidibacillus organovorans]OAG94206.1 3-ketoacyl-ACP reductase [Ferroacidibacillus organovorans]OPG16238.1 3-oxoacyl-ACP reductase [Ferroacidibacillus organovorans]